MFRITQSREHSRVIGSWILTNDQNDISVVEILKGDRSFPDPNGLPETFSAGFMAHV